MQLSAKIGATSRVNVTASFSAAPANAAASNNIGTVIAFVFMRESPSRSTIVVRTEDGFNTTGRELWPNF